MTPAEVRFVTFGPVRVGLAEIAADERPRRERERGAVATIVEAALGRAAKVEHRDDGAPFIADYEGYISISHSRRMAAVAFCTDRLVGVDVESVDRSGQIERVAGRVMSPAEMEAYQGVRAWTLKEALYKVAGEPGIDWRSGLRLPVGDGERAWAGEFICEVYNEEIDGEMVAVAVVVEIRSGLRP